MDTQLTPDQIIIASEIGSARRYVKDPAIDRDDIKQEICLYLLQRPSIDSMGLAVHAARQIMPKLMRASVVHRGEYGQFEKYEEVKSRDEDILSQLVKSECDEQIEIAFQEAKLSDTQRKVITYLRDGYTPVEIGNLLGTSRRVIGNCITAAVMAIRENLCIPIDGPIKLGHCRMSQITERESRERGCQVCGVLFTPQRIDAKYCGNACRQKSRYKKHTKA